MLDLLEVALPTATADSPASTVIVTSVSSDGFMHIYDLALLSQASAGEVAELEPSAKYDTDGTRLTCVCAIGMAERKGDGTKAKLALDGVNVDDDDDDESSDEDDDDEASGSDEEEQSEGGEQDDDEDSGSEEEGEEEEFAGIDLED